MTLVSSGSREFDLLREKLQANQALRDELEYALRVNVSRVNPTDRANRFGSGAAVEWILAAVAYNAGVLSAPAGHNADGFDLRDLRKQAQGLWSVKNSTRKRSDFRLTNGMGGSGKGFQDPVIMLSPSLPGLVFADPTKHRDLADSARETGDAVILPFRAVEAFAWMHPECVATCLMPVNDGSGQDDPWMDYVASLLDRVRFPRLARMFVEASPPSRSIVDEVVRLAQLRDSGVITSDSFENAVAALGR